MREHLFVFVCCMYLSHVRVSLYFFEFVFLVCVCGLCESI